MKTLFFFLDGVGLGVEDPDSNPFARADLPALENLLGGQRLLAHAAGGTSENASLVPLDACMGIGGLPQSATGQATLLTGVNVPAAIGRHYGPKPNPEIKQILTRQNIFKEFARRGGQAALLNAYPARYHDAIASGRRLYSAVPLAVTSAGLTLKTDQELLAGTALSADFSGQGWREMLGYPQAPLLTFEQAGEAMARLALSLDFAFFEFWLSDFIGHRQDMGAALDMLEKFDRVLSGLLAAWPLDSGLIVITSDHGNLEDLSTRRHTTNPVPCLVIGSQELRRGFVESLQTLEDVAPAILGAHFGPPE